MLSDHRDIHKLQVGLMDERRRLQRPPPLFTDQVAVRNRFQLVVNESDQAVERAVVVPLCRLDERCHL